MGKNIEPIYNDASKFWNKYSALYEGKLTLKNEILEKEVNKYALGTNEKAKSIGWEPKVSMEQGIKNSVDYAIKLLREKK